MFLRTISRMLKSRNTNGFLDKLNTVVRYGLVKFYKFSNTVKKLPVRGSKDIEVLFHPGCAISEKLYVVGMYDYDGMSFLLDYVKDGDIFFDVGANVGPFSILLSKNTQYIYAFEGHPITTERLKKNFMINNINPDQAKNLAISDHEGEVSFLNNSGSSINKISTQEDDTLTVTSKTLDNLSEIYGTPRFVKIDTEGHELSVLKGMGKILSSGIVDFISFEANGILNENELGEIYKILTDNNYLIGNIDYDNRVFTYLDNLGRKSPTGDYRALSNSLINEIKTEQFTVSSIY